ncbi:MAG: alpha/beta hydrolase [candidate division Zixibacteria bacterium]|nr:alpha/beta hydrolase [candidate division Zixibacteria bacterium]
MHKNLVFTASDSEVIATTAYYPESNQAQGIVVYVHGFKGFKDWGFVPYIGSYLANHNFAAITFNFSHNGIGENLLEFTEEDKFAANTLSREIRELSEIITAIRNNFFNVSGPIGVLGHSRGGGIALLQSATCADVEAVTTWSSVSTFNRYSDAVKKSWREKGYLEVANKRTGQIMRLNTTLLDDIEQNGEMVLNVEKAVANMNKPLLVIHGCEDEGVPLAEADAIYAAAGKNITEIIKVEKTGHTFNAAHPFGGGNPKLDFVLDKTVQFFKKNL